MVSKSAAQAKTDSPNARSVAAMLLDRVAATPTAEAFRWNAGGAWKSMTWRETGERVRDIACGLRAIGLADEERVALLASTRLEWILADLGILGAGGATTTIYPSSTADECAFILSDSASAFAFAENDQQVAKLVAKRGELPSLRKVIVMDGAPGHDGWVTTLADLERQGREAHAAAPDGYERIARAIQPAALATIIYTSGTTGRPKGVELTHDSWVYEGEAIAKLGLLRADDVQYLWLPLAHAFGKVLVAAQVHLGFSTAVEGRVDKLVENLPVIRPTIVAAVPRIFEKVHNKVITTATAGSPMKRRIFRWALRVGKEAAALERSGQRPSLVLAMMRSVADRLVFGKIRDRFGGRLRYFVSGSAPLSRDIAEFFHAAGILVLEGYGLTETSAASFVNLPGKFRFGTVGLPLEGTEVKIADSDGEILLRGRGVMRAYHGLDEETRSTLDADGWLHTGDIGKVHPEGFLEITDRKKDLIKTSGGKYVAPQMVEGKLKAICPYLSQVLVHGNNRNFCSALVTLDEEAVKKWAQAQGVAASSAANLAKAPEVQKLVQGYVDQLNKELPSYETLKKFAILPSDLSQEAGELTPSLKVKRKVVEERYRKILDGFYAGSMTEA